MESEAELRKKAQQRAEEKVGFYIHFVIYIMVNSMLIVFWYLSAGGNLSSFPWFLFPLLGWGIGIVGHGLGVFLGTSFTEKMAEKEYEKLKRK